MADSLHSDDVSSLARELAQRVEALCPHVPAAELAELTSRLALSQYAHASGVSFANAELEAVLPPLGNRIAWLPGSASAIVLPAGDDAPGARETAARILEWARRRALPVRGMMYRGFIAIRQIASADSSAPHAGSP